MKQMNGLVKSLLYQLKKDRLVYIVFFLILLIELEQVFFGDGAEVKSASEYIGTMGGSFYSWIYMFIGVVVARVCGADFGDKTFNYEILSGYTRKETYLVRAWISLIISVVGTVILSNVPFVFAIILKGFGTKLSFESILLHQVLCLFPMIRTTCFLIFLIFVIRNQYLIMVLGFMFFNMSQILMNIPSYLLGLTNVSLLCSYESFSTFSFSGENYYVYDGRLSLYVILLTIVVSLVMSGVWLFIGYTYYKRDDLR